MYDMLNKIKYAKNDKSKKESKCFIYDCKYMSSRRCGSYRMYLESDSPYQAVMIV